MGRLLVRTGRLAPALAEFEAATRDLLGSELAVETADAGALPWPTNCCWNGRWAIWL
ncbi:MAG: hypothetical protein R2854_30095 [Caldilineaceae bacterium]